MVHVVSSAATALMLAHRKRIHTAFIPFPTTPATEQACAKLDEMHIRHIFVPGRLEGQWLSTSELVGILP